MTKKELLQQLEPFNDDDIIIVVDETGGWDNIKEIEKEGCCINIIFGGGSPFSDE